MSLRPIMVDGVPWRYCVRPHGLYVRGAPGQHYWLTMPMLTGIAYDELDRAAWKGCELPAITPSIVADAIRWVQQPAPRPPWRYRGHHYATGYYHAT
jgi:hypothetical protein